MSGTTRLTAVRLLEVEEPASGLITDYLPELAERDEPDPWLVADRLLRKGQRELALQFAEAKPRPAVAGLVAYLASEDGRHINGEHIRIDGAALDESAVAAFRNAMDDDMGTPEAVATIFETVRRANAALDAGNGWEYAISLEGWEPALFALDEDGRAHHAVGPHHHVGTDHRMGTDLDVVPEPGRGVHPDIGPD